MVWSGAGHFGAHCLGARTSILGAGIPWHRRQ